MHAHRDPRGPPLPLRREQRRLDRVARGRLRRHRPGGVAGRRSRGAIPGGLPGRTRRQGPRPLEPSGHDSAGVPSGARARRRNRAGAAPADPCRLLTMSPMWREAGFALHRVRSNQAAERGTDPCGPQFPQRPYRALVPAAPAVRMAEPDEHATIVLRAASDRPDAPWLIRAVELSGREPRPGFVDLALDRSVVASGDAATLTITLRRARGREPIVIALLSTDGDQTDMWPVAVITRADRSSRSESAPRAHRGRRR